MAPPIRTRPRFFHSQSLPWGSLHKPLILIFPGQTEWKPQSQKTNQTDHMDHSLVYSMKLWAMPCRAHQEERVMVENSDKTWSTRERNSKPLNYSCLKDELPRSVGDHDATGEEWRNNSRKKKRQSQSKYSVRLWMWIVIEVKSNAVKNNIA